MKLLQLIDKYDYVLAVVVSIATWFIGLMTTKLASYKKRKKVKKILALKKSNTDIFLPVRPGEIKLNTNVGVTVITDEFVTFHEALSIFGIERVVQEVGGNISEPSKMIQSNEIETSNNAFYLGGPLANHQVARFFREFFPGVKFGCPPNSKYLNEKNRDSLFDFVFVDDSDDVGNVDFSGDMVQFGRNTEGYVILIRLMGKDDFGDCNHGTVHICFGNSAVTTRAAAKCYTAYGDELYRRLKGKHGHYFIFLKCTSEGVVNFNTFQDMTDKAFAHQ